MDSITRRTLEEELYARLLQKKPEYMGEDDFAEYFLGAPDRLRPSFVAEQVEIWGSNEFPRLGKVSTAELSLEDFAKLWKTSQSCPNPTEMAEIVDMMIEALLYAHSDPSDLKL